jgi:RNA polymerase sigma factor (sigma-70 family)
MDGEQDAQSFDVTFARHHDQLTRELAIPVRRVYRRWDRPTNPWDIEDEVSNLVGAILKAKKNYDPSRGSFKAWANGVAMHRLSDRARQFGRESNRPVTSYESSYPGEVAFELLIAHRAAILGPEPPDERIEILLTEMDRLPAKERITIRRRIWDDEAYASIAHDLGVTEAAARGIYSRGMERLGEIVQELLVTS